MNAFLKFDLIDGPIDPPGDLKNAFTVLDYELDLSILANLDTIKVADFSPLIVDLKQLPSPFAEIQDSLADFDLFGKITLELQDDFGAGEETFQTITLEGANILSLSLIHI